MGFAKLIIRYPQSPTCGVACYNTISSIASCISKSGLQNYIMQSATIPSKNILNSLGLLLYAKNLILGKKKEKLCNSFLLKVRRIAMHFLLQVNIISFSALLSRTIL